MRNKTNAATHRSNTLERGEWAEQFAERWLRQQGLIPYARNFKRRLGEIDLIMRDPSSNGWVFVEVKYRKAHALVSGLDAIDVHKRRRLQRTAALFLQRQQDSTNAARIDVLLVSPAIEKQLSAADQGLSGCVQQLCNGYSVTWIKSAVGGQ